MKRARSPPLRVTPLLAQAIEPPGVWRREGDVKLATVNRGGIGDRRPVGKRPREFLGLLQEVVRGVLPPEQINVRAGEADTEGHRAEWTRDLWAGPSLRKVKHHAVLIG